MKETKIINGITYEVISNPSGIIERLDGANIYLQSDGDKIDIEKIICKGNISSKGYIYSKGNIYSEGNISSF